MKNLTVDESRLIAIRRAIEKFNNPQIISAMDASVISAYVTGLLDLDKLEELASPDQIEYFLDGLVLGLAASRLLEANIDVEDLPKSKQQAAKQFQTGIDPTTGEVKVND